MSTPTGDPFSYIDRNGTTHISEVVINTDTGLNPNFIFDNVYVTDGSKANITG